MLFRGTNDDRFVSILQNHIRNTYECAMVLDELFNGRERELNLKKMISHEHEGDSLAGDAHRLLAHTFISTYFELDDIMRLIDQLDNIVDAMKDASVLVDDYGVIDMKPEASHFTKIISQMVAILRNELEDLPKIKLSKLQETAREIKVLEERADAILRETRRTLVKEKPELFVVWKDIFERLEKSTDHCRRLMNTLSSVVLKNPY